MFSTQDPILNKCQLLTLQPRDPLVSSYLPLHVKSFKQKSLKSGQVRLTGLSDLQRRQTQLNPAKCYADHILHSCVLVAGSKLREELRGQ